MPEPQVQTSDSEGSAGNTASEEIARSLGSVWQRFSGQRPKSTNVEIEKDVVRCVIEENSPDALLEEDGESTVDADASPDSRRFDYNAAAAVTRVTGRRVIAFIPKRDKTNMTSTQTFILDRPRQKF
jgi:hypothetical protein